VVKIADLTYIIAIYHIKHITVHIKDSLFGIAKKSQQKQITTKTKQNKQQNVNKTEQKSRQNQNMIKNLVY